MWVKISLLFFAIAKKLLKCKEMKFIRNVNVFAKCNAGVILILVSTLRFKLFSV